MTRRERGKPSGTETVGRGAALIGGILVTQLAAIALSLATATTDPWPWGLENLRRHPFAWSAAMTGLLALFAVITFGTDAIQARRDAEQAATEAKQAEQDARRATHEALLHRLSDLVHRLGVVARMLDWCRRTLAETLEGAGPSLGRTELRDLWRAASSRRNAMSLIVDRVIQRMRDLDGHASATLPRERLPSQATSDFGDRAAAEASTKEGGPSIGKIGVWLQHAREQLRELDEELQGLKIAFDHADSLLNAPTLGEVVRSDCELVANTCKDVTSWRRDLKAIDGEIEIFMTKVLGVPTEP